MTRLEIMKKICLVSAKADMMEIIEERVCDYADCPLPLKGRCEAADCFTCWKEFLEQDVPEFRVTDMEVTDNHDGTFSVGVNRDMSKETALRLLANLVASLGRHGMTMNDIMLAVNAAFEAMYNEGGLE